MAAFVSWQPIITGIIEEIDGMKKYAASDEELVPAIGAYLRSNPGFELLFVQLDDVDAAAIAMGMGKGLWNI